jgi:hypothetical protein
MSSEILQAVELHFAVVIPDQAIISNIVALFICYNFVTIVVTILSTVNIGSF